VSNSSARGTIISHLGDAQYSVKMQHGDAERLDALIEIVANRRQELKDWLDDEVDPKVSEYESQLSTALSELDSAINAYNADKSPENWDAVLDATTKARKARAELRPWKLEQDLVTLERSRLYWRGIYLANKKAEIEQTESLWCRDLRDDDNDPPATGHYTKIAAGELVSVSYQGRQYDGPGNILDVIPDADTDSGAGHYFGPRELLSTELYVAMAMLPGAETWNPTVRYATIIDIDYGADTCSIAFDPLERKSDVWRADASSIDTKKNFKATAVPIVYMDCNSWAFQVGDHVVVSFDEGSTQPWLNPTVIGFVDHPKICKYPGGFQFWDGDNSEYIFVQWDDVGDEYVKSTGSIPKVGSTHWVKDFSGTLHHVSVVYPGLDANNPCYPQYITPITSGGQIVHNQTLLPALPNSTNGSPNYPYHASAAGRNSSGDIEAIGHYSYNGAIGADDRSGMGWFTYNGSSWSIDWEQAQETESQHFCLGTVSAMDVSCNFKGTCRKYDGAVSKTYKVEANSSGATFVEVPDYLGTEDRKTAKTQCVVGQGIYDAFYSCGSTWTGTARVKVTSSGVVSFYHESAESASSDTGACYIKDSQVKTIWTAKRSGVFTSDAVVGTVNGTYVHDSGLAPDCSAVAGTSVESTATGIWSTPWVDGVYQRSDWSQVNTDGNVLSTTVDVLSGGSGTAGPAVALVEYISASSAPCASTTTTYANSCPDLFSVSRGWIDNFHFCAQAYLSNAVGFCFLEVNSTKWSTDGYKFIGPFDESLLSSDLANADIIVSGAIPKVS